MNITVLTDEEVTERFGWAWAEVMAAKYSVPVDHTHRLAEAAVLTSTDRDLIERRYLQNDKTAVVPAEFVAVFSEPALAARRGW